MREIDILGDVRTAPVHTEHVAVREKRMGAYEHTAGPEEPILRQAPQDLFMSRHDHRTSERVCGTDQGFEFSREPGCFARSMSWRTGTLSRGPT